MAGNVGLAEAARLVGRNQSTIHRALKTGRLSFTRGPDGERRIDPAELDRVFGDAMANASGERNGVQPAGQGMPQAVRDERERIIAQQDETIRDLRTRLDAAEERFRASEAERRQLGERLAGLLPAPAAPKRRWWWQAR